MSILEQRKVVLFTSVGNEALHGFVEDLRARAPSWVLVGVDVREDAAGRFRCDVHETVPRRDAPDFLPRLQTLIATHGVDLVVPLSTEDQDWFCRSEIHRALAPAAVLTSSPEAVAIANRKTSLFEHLAEHPSWLPAHAFVQSAQEARAVVPEFVAAHGAMLLKSDASTGGRGMVCVGRPSADPAPAVGRSFLPLDVWSELCDASPATQVSMLPSVFGSGARWPQLANAYLPGEEFSVDVLCDAGRVLASVVRRRDAAIGGLATSAQVVDAPDVAALANAIVASVGLSHVVNVQFRRDASGAPKLMEINPRTPGTIGLTVAAGFNLPLAAFARAMGGDVALPSAPEFGVSCCRYQAMTLHRE